jgi:hypothetical protein
MPFGRLVGSDVSKRLMWRLDTRSVALAMIVVGLPLQILIAPHAGFCADLK